MVDCYKYGLWVEGSELKDRKDIKATFQSTGYKMSTFHKIIWIWQLCRLAFINIARDIWTQSVQLLRCVWLLATPWKAEHQASLSITNSRERAQTHVHWVGDAIQPTISSNHLDPIGTQTSTQNSAFWKVQIWSEFLAKFKKIFFFFKSGTLDSCWLLRARDCGKQPGKLQQPHSASRCLTDGFFSSAYPFPQRDF